MFDISYSGPAAFLALVQAAIKYMKEVYRPQIELWISAANGFAASRAQAQVDAFMDDKSAEAT